MAVVMGLDQRRAQITAESQITAECVDTSPGEVSRARTAGASCVPLTPTP